MVLTSNEYLFAGSISGLLSRAVSQPLDVLKIRFQLQVEPISSSTTSKYHGFVQAIRCISKEEGRCAFWKGHIPSQLQAVVFSAVQFLSFEILVAGLVSMTGLTGSICDPKLELKSTNTLGTFTCGCLAGSMAASVTQPLDVLRTRFIAQGEPRLYRNMAHAAFHILSREGTRGFFRGIVPSLLLITPQTGLQFAIYHTSNQLLNVVRERWNRTMVVNADVLVNDGVGGKSGAYPHRVSALQSLISGSIAGMGSKCIIYPLDMVKKRMQIQGFEEGRAGFGRMPTARGLRNCFLTIWNIEGATAVFKGLRPALLKSCVSISCRFTVYEQLCYLIHSSRHTDLTL